ncbi:hypothetical protein [Hartmannibacter diazotrophicus]|uniref:hypothetical protein n=1 Tax=Hartmannibacter diazotrophicus TaxID=1482074 RepID=UPI0012FD9668|nr:hypothetical protein [Hartmannibacter diazotrophicus]
MISIAPEVLLADAQEMHLILSTAECLERHANITLGTLAEILTALSTDGKLAEPNRKGFDVISPAYGRIEVKSRVLGTDGAFPRISLSPNKIDGADHFMAVRWDQHSKLCFAIMLPKASILPLYQARLQRSGNIAHLHWDDWLAARDAVDFTDQFQELLSIDASSFRKSSIQLEPQAK